MLPFALWDRILPDTLIIRSFTRRFTVSWRTRVMVALFRLEGSFLFLAPRVSCCREMPTYLFPPPHLLQYHASATSFSFARWNLETGWAQTPKGEKMSEERQEYLLTCFFEFLSDNTSIPFGVKFYVKGDDSGRNIFAKRIMILGC